MERDWELAEMVYRERYLEDKDPPDPALPDDFVAHVLDLIEEAELRRLQ